MRDDFVFHCILFLVCVACVVTTVAICIKSERFCEDRDKGPAPDLQESLCVLIAAAALLTFIGNVYISAWEASSLIRAEYDTDSISDSLRDITIIRALACFLGGWIYAMQSSVVVIVTGGIAVWLTCGRRHVDRN